MTSGILRRVFWLVYRRFRGFLLTPSSGRTNDGDLPYKTKVNRRPAGLRRFFTAAEHVRIRSEAVVVAIHRVTTHTCPEVHKS